MSRENRVVVSHEDDSGSIPIGFLPPGGRIGLINDVFYGFRRKGLPEVIWEKTT
jgi:hypothetical protein